MRDASSFLAFPMLRTASILLIVALVVGMLSSAPSGFAAEQALNREENSLPYQSQTSGERYAPDRILVRFKPGVAPETIASIHATMGTATLKVLRGIDVHVIRIPAGKTVPEVMLSLRANPNVEYAEPDYERYKMPTPNDTYFGSQWAYYQASDVDMDAPQGWDIQTGSASIIIAVIDDGIDYNHPDLDGKLWTNPGEIAGNGIDDDGNGYVDDVRGWDFGTDDNDVMHRTASDGHGTATAGIAAAESNNAQGVAGTAWGVTIMPLKVEDAGGNIYDSYIAEAITYAADNGAHVLSMSLGGAASSTTLSDACTYGWTTKGKVLVAATGNENTSVSYPAAYPTTIAVGASNEYDVRAGFSNYGAEVDVVAPGVNIYTTDRVGSKGYAAGDYYSEFGGTSASTPFVAGLAAILLSQNPTLTNTQVRDLIRATAEEQVGGNSSGFDNSYGYGRINIDAALRSLTGTVDGTGKAHVSPQAVGTQSRNNITFTLVAEAATFGGVNNTITTWELTVPSSCSWSQSSSDIVNLSAGADGATVNVVGNVITLSGLNIDKGGNYPSGSFTIRNLIAPVSTGNYTFSSRTAKLGGTLTSLDSDEQAAISVVSAVGSYFVYSVASGADGPGASLLNLFDIVIWEVGDTWDNESLRPADRTTIGSYLDGGGKLFVAGELVVADLSTGTDTDTAFLNSRLGVNSSTSGYNADRRDIDGQTGTVGAGLTDIVLRDPGVGARTDLFWLLITDPYSPSSSAAFQTGGWVAGPQKNVAVQKSGVVTLSFGLSAFGTRANRQTLVGNIIAFLDATATRILLVDDDRGLDNRETYYQRALEDNSYVYKPWPFWEAHNSNAPARHLYRDDNFGEGENSVYMYGAGFQSNTTYKIIFWDQVNSTWYNRQTEVNTSDDNGSLSALHTFTLGTDTEGNWHATVYNASTDPSTYDPNDSDIIADNVFYVAPQAIPEFPTVLAAIVVAGLCFGIYYWLRKKRLAYRQIGESFNCTI